MSELPDLDGYFGSIRTALTEAGFNQPVVVIDKSRLDANLNTLQQTLPSQLAVRVVAKSLPSLPLIQHVADHLGTDRLMTFNLPMLQQLSHQMPQADQLLGKPFPVSAAAQFYRDAGAEANERVRWLIDTEERLGQYEALASEVGVRIRVCLELDVGLHRGGFDPGSTLRDALYRVNASDDLEFSGFMGYEAHLAKIPELGRLRDKALQQSMELYSESIDLASAILGADRVEGVVRNSAGSMTYRLHDGSDIANETSIGSVLLKGTDFDLDLLEPFEPAVFIATTVLKVLDSIRLPGLDFAQTITDRLSSKRKTLFVHGGHWLAEPEFPVGMSNYSLWGRSSNQEMFHVDLATSVAPDDFVFLRPHQTEAVLLQFGDIAVYENGSIVDSWPTLAVSA